MPRNQSKKSGTISPEKVALYDRCHQHIQEIKWTVTGKVKEILYDAEYLNKHIEFIYNPMGNRIGKVVTTNGDVTKTFYTLDAQGNSMAIYTIKSEQNQKKLYLSERCFLASI
jgi:hypothetical protein